MADALRRHLGYDGKALPSHSTGCRDRSTGRTLDDDADWGRHGTCGVDARTGKAWTKVGAMCPSKAMCYIHLASMPSLGHRAVTTDEIKE